jgi:putative NADH-flavin reductase
MKIVALGATGGIGVEIIRQAITRGHEVTAVARAPERLQEFGTSAKLVRASLLNSSELEKAVAGHDAVLSAFGPRTPVSNGDAHLLRDFAIALTAAMKNAELTRVMMVSVAFLFKNAFLPPAYLLGKLLFPQVVADSAAMEQVFEKSGLEWTMVRPPKLTDGPSTGRYRMREGHLPSFGFNISRADVADFMIRAAEKRLSIRKVVGVCN